ncbi:PTS mannose/fructose/sorbose/N-acetylgalactosamine transporter subunit IIC [Lactiplantibacillus daoliensis]|uniref:PTS mannose/fructose/sorbose/N-acetylgalactosamine transporter subunit IIC n=1 Tax=Lactiplantibacillus daoliensis TaxID=2559916 RepID=A0ABW1UGH4_9LACO|nr:PTS sugar transporter subunit IIC [Lactiplantibacillus daoliensis]
MIMQALAVGLACALVKFGAWWGAMGWDRPMVASTITGILLGHPVEGMTVGAALELVYMGTQSMGGVLPQDYGLGGVFGCAFAILATAKPSVAVALSIPFSMLGTLIYDLFKFWATSLITRFQKHLEDHQIGAFKRLWFTQATVYLTMYFLIGFISILLGTNAIKALVNNIPTAVMSSLTVAAGMLPALGMALLMITLWDKKLAPYFFIGFGLVAFFKGTLIEIAFLGAAIAVLAIIGQLTNHKTDKVAATTEDATTSEEEDFYND